MKITWMIAFAALLTAAAPTLASAQTVQELRAQLSQLNQQIADADAAGVDPSLIATLREMADQAEQTIRDMEAEQASPGATVEPEAATASMASYTPQGNVLDDEEACAGFTLSNYRERGLAEGNDVQLNTMCAQAFEYYVMYRRAIEQGYSEADANRTFEAHRAAALNAKAFYESARAD